MHQLGIIGVGNMGEAILRGILKEGVVKAEDIVVFDTNVKKTAALSNELGITVADQLESFIEKSKMILFAVKPNVIGAMLDSYRSLFHQKGIISIIAGWSADRLSDNLPNDTRILRVMPNTPAMIGDGMIVFESGDTLTKDEKAFAVALFSSIGRVTTVDPQLMDAVTGVSGSGPAYVYLFIEAMADAGVQQGLPRAVAYELAAQTVKGAARMVLESGQHPGQLKDNVCSPGGTTIDAVATLEKRGFRGAVIEAIEACSSKSREMSKNI